MVKRPIKVRYARMSNRITIIDGHPDPDLARFVHALAGEYARGAESAGRDVRRLDLAWLDIPLLRSRQDWAEGHPSAAITEAQQAIEWAEHLAIFYPLWLGDVPALLKAFLEQVMRPNFALREGAGPTKMGLLKGRSARIVVTMGMPAFFYRFYFGAHSVKSLERNILKLVGIAPVRHTLIGNVEGDARQREAWLKEMFDLGEAGA
jgi:putative NADPH-quinone reductase